MLTHHLKCWPEYFDELASGNKRFEIRRDDRSFGKGDKVVIEEWNPDTGKYTGRCIKFTISYILRDASRFGLQWGYCILSLSSTKNK
jgi:hypothetical protein